MVGAGRADRRAHRRRAERPDGGYDVALVKTVEFVQAHFADPADGVWFDTVAADGTVLFRRKAHDWQSSYHDVRALVKFADAYAP